MNKFIQKVQNQSNSHRHPKLRVFSLEIILFLSVLNYIFLLYILWQWRLFTGEFFKKKELWFFQGSLLIVNYTHLLPPLDLYVSVWQAHAIKRHRCGTRLEMILPRLESRLLRNLRDMALLPGPSKSTKKKNHRDTINKQDDGTRNIY